MTHITTGGCGWPEIELERLNQAAPDSGSICPDSFPASLTQRSTLVREISERNFVLDVGLSVPLDLPNEVPQCRQFRCGEKTRMFPFPSKE